MEMHWLVAARGRPVEHFIDLHEMWLAPRTVFQESFESVGFDTTYDPKGLTGRGLFVGCRRG